MNYIRYLLDENVESVFRIALLQQEPSMIVWKVGDPGAPPNGTKDPEILEWCEKNTFILVTNNRKSMPKHLMDHIAQGKDMPGILELNPNMSIRETVEELILIWGASELLEYKNIILYLPIN
ncbi:hypothetical protein TI05_07290 [Achromatium sp. WMS3]|nr:hypothetical protein TI05_07290 [Achromatium sp. WMS3]